MSQISAEIYGTLEVSVEGASSTITVEIGTPGPAASVTVGTTTTGAAGSSAVVANAGTTAAAVLNFTIPRGDTGATGPAGAAGQGVPVGGTDGQVLAKIDTTDYNTTWVTPFAQQVRNQVRNETGATLTAGTVVYVTGASGNKVTVTKAQANGDATSAQTFAVLLENIANNSNGYAVTSGLLENLDTSAFAAGTQLYLSPTTAGTYTSTKPSAPDHLVYIGVIERSHVNQGTMLVRIQNGYELEELHNVAINGLANNDLLAYDSATTLWKNKTFGTLGLLTSSTAASTYAPLASPALTGNPTAPTPLTADNDTSIATTAFVKAQGYLTTAPVTSVAGKTGVVTLAVADVSGAAPLASPALTGTPTAPTATAGTSTTQIATTAFVTAVDVLKAPLASPTFTGTPAAPTATAGTNTTQLATTAFVTTADNLKANIASPTFTGVPAAPTASPGTSTTQLATTAFVTAVDILKAPLASPTFTGTVTIPAGASISGYLTTSSAASTYQTLSGMSSYLTTSAAASTYLTQSNAASTYQTLSGMSSYLTTSAAASTYQPIGSYLTDAPSDGNTYGRLNGAWSVVGGGGSVAWGAITGTVTDQTDLVTYVTGLGYQTASDVSTYVSGLGYVAGTAASQLTAGTYTTNPAAAPTASGDVLQFDGTNLIWAAGGGGGGLTISTLSNGATSTLNATVPTTGQALTYDGTDLVWATAGGGVAWGAITGTLSSQTDLQTALDGKLPVKSVNAPTGSYTLASTDANQVVYIDTSPVIIPKDSTYSFPVGTVITVCYTNGTTFTVNPEDAFMNIPNVNGSTASATCQYVATLVKVAADNWCVSI
jgi:hypothetical protein